MPTVADPISPFPSAHPDASDHFQLSPVLAYLRTLQDQICAGLEALDGEGHFLEDAWERPDGGGGRTRVLRAGQVFEQAGVNFSHVRGTALPPSATAQRPELAGRCFEAGGVSLVIHPSNPFVPTSHANVRFFVAEKPGEPAIWWFGGGFDLTPYYGFDADCVHWHRTAEAACRPFGADLYPTFKKNCDEYFFLKHRQEPRGIGGLFFDDFQRGGFTSAFALLRSIADHYLPAYGPLVERRKAHPYTAAQREFQLYRRGRYVEFNLLHDRGTLFGIQSGGRTESILMSLPPQVRWEYGYTPSPDTPEALLYSRYLQPRDWLHEPL